mmetsp:Transcript_3200/g.13088  ORF Transcript_3200/g.13088 Transcript_3200/m.13088 type:complete len:277 (-) Transcript_3200:91-921(-)
MRTYIPPKATRVSYTFAREHDFAVTHSPLSMSNVKKCTGQLSSFCPPSPIDNTDPLASSPPACGQIAAIALNCPSTLHSANRSPRTSTSFPVSPWPGKSTSTSAAHSNPFGTKHARKPARSFETFIDLPAKNTRDGRSPFRCSEISHEASPQSGAFGPSPPWPLAPSSASSRPRSSRLASSRSVNTPPTPSTTSLRPRSPASSTSPLHLAEPPPAAHTDWIHSTNATLFNAPRSAQHAVTTRPSCELPSASDVCTSGTVASASASAKLGSRRAAAD